jgi:hypothetical protein
MMRWCDIHQCEYPDWWDCEQCIAVDPKKPRTLDLMGALKDSLGKRAAAQKTNGAFFADFGGERPYATPLKLLLDKLRARTTRAKIEVSWFERDYRSDEKLKIVDGFLTGVHATYFLLRTVDGKAEHESTYGNHLLRRLTEKEKARFYQLQAEMATAERALAAFRKTLEVDGHALLKAARAEAEP